MSFEFYNQVRLWSGGDYGERRGGASFAERSRSHEGGVGVGEH